MTIDLTGIDSDKASFQVCDPLCDDGDCLGCAAVECPHGEPLHRDKDGCPSCDGTGEEAE